IHEAARPEHDARDDCDRVLEGPVEAFREAEDREHRDRAAELERNDAVDRAPREGDHAQRYVPAQERGRRDFEGVHAGDSERRSWTRSWSVTCSSSMSMT